MSVPEFSAATSSMEPLRACYSSLLSLCIISFKLKFEMLESADLETFCRRFLLPSGSKVWKVFRLVYFCNLRGYGLVFYYLKSLLSVDETNCLSESILNEHVTMLSRPVLFTSDFDFWAVVHLVGSTGSLSSGVGYFKLKCMSSWHLLKLFSL